MKEHVIGPASRGKVAGPFTAAEIIAAYDTLVKNGDVANAMKGRMLEGEKCEYCDGTGYKRLKKLDDNSFVDVLWNSQEETSTMARCHCRQVVKS